ncbi:MAG: hypothetical protein U0531_22540 [Dehalococcoidia bacterium]
MDESPERGTERTAQPAPLDGAGLDWRYWRDVHRFAVGPFNVRPKDGGGWYKRPARNWSAAKAVRPWWGLSVGAPETWARRWRPGLHVGRSRVVVLDIDGPDGHKGRPPLDVQRAAIRAALGVDPLDVAPIVWRTAGGGWACLWYLPPGVEPPPRRVVTLPGCSFTVEILSGEWVAVLPHAAAAAPYWTLQRPPVARDDPAAHPLPPALWAALTAPRERLDADEDADAAAAKPAPSVLDVARLDAVAAHVRGAVRSVAGSRAPCPCCERRGKTSRRLALYVRRDGRIGLRCHGGCTRAAILSRLTLPADVLLFIERTPDDDGPHAAACRRMLAAIERDVMTAPARQRKGDRRFLVALVVAALRAATLDDFAASVRSIGLVAGIGPDALRGGAKGGKPGIITRCLSRYPP